MKNSKDYEIYRIFFLAFSTCALTIFAFDALDASEKIANEFCSRMLASAGNLLAEDSQLSDEQIHEIFSAIIADLPLEDLKALQRNPLVNPAFSEPHLRVNQEKFYVALLDKMQSGGQLQNEKLKTKWREIFVNKIETEISKTKIESQQRQNSKARSQDIFEEDLLELPNGNILSELINNGKQLAVIPKGANKYQVWDLESKKKVVEILLPFTPNYAEISRDGKNIYLYTENWRGISFRSIFPKVEIGRIDSTGKSFSFLRRDYSNWISNLFRAEKRALLATAFFHHSPIVAITRNNYKINPESRVLELWDLESKKIVESKDLPPPDELSGTTIAVSDDDSQIAIGGGLIPTHVWYWDRASDQTKLIETMIGSSLSFSPFNRNVLLVGGANDNKLFYLDDSSVADRLGDGKGFHFLDKSPQIFYLRNENIYTLDPTNKIGDRILIWVPATTYLIQSGSLHTFSPNGKFFFYLSYDKQLCLHHIYDEFNSRPVLEAPAPFVTFELQVVFSRDRASLLLIYNSGKVQEIKLSHLEENP